ncbi:MAG: Ig-like domain-containing protein, partial [Gemmatimonadaceae bacterium]
MGRCVVILGVTLGVCVACARDTHGGVGIRCGDITVPGTVVSPAGIQLTLRNRFGAPVAAGASIVALNGNGAAISSFSSDSLTATIYGTAVGTYTAQISKPFYRDTTLANVAVLPGECPGIVQTTKQAVVLTISAGAPPVRSVAVFGTTFLATGGSQAHLVALVDADSGVSRAVTWRVSDTTMAKIDQSGLLTAKCSLRGGADTV